MFEVKLESKTFLQGEIYITIMDNTDVAKELVYSVMNEVFYTMLLRLDGETSLE